MKVTVEGVGKKVEDAVENALKRLGASIDEVEIKVISSGGFLKKAKVEVSMGSDDEPYKPVSDAKTETKSETKKDTKPETKQDVKSEVKTDAKSNVKQNIKHEPKKDFKPNQNNNQSKPDTNANANAAKNEKPQFEKKSENSNKRDEKKYDDKKKFDSKPYQPYSDSALKQASDFVGGLIEKMGIEGSASSTNNDGIFVSVDTTDSAIIGRRGETLESIAYLASLVVKEEGSRMVKVRVDALNYREGREDSLKKLANRMADKCVKNGRKVLLDAMTSSERKVIHAELALRSDVVTRSEGKEPYRKVVILPAKNSNR